MGLLEWLPFYRNKSPASSLEFDIDDLFIDFQKAYLKTLAIDKSAEFVARIFSKAEFLFLKNGEVSDNSWSYLLNVKPNKDDVAARFWQKVIYRLIVHNEVLLVLSDDNQLLIADSYTRREYALYDDVFESVVVKDYQFKRSFKREDVIFIEYNNQRLTGYLNQLSEDYQTLYDRLVEAIARNNQIRGTLKIKGASQFANDYMEKLKSYSERLFNAFKHKSIAIVPMIDQVEYSEFTNKLSGSSVSVEDLKKLKYQFEDDVADLIGIPSVMLHGEIAGIEEARKSFTIDCLKPLTKKVSDELTVGLIDEREYKNGLRLEIIKVVDRDILDLSSNIDKIVSSGAFFVNEVRREVGYTPIKDGNVIIRTKNYEVASNQNEKGEINVSNTD
ncbi:HK97 family phage portal protein [Streptococcus varani]|uniref:HK97 family phage portal protein n=1 Tax=Streptococcus varani TaxID=1608583 RepID=A0A0E4H463_9STRE|nr:phage portal protein [Streptococcus varani]CQR24586.1 HK97 family phage portal protein [Streptococcus varani]